jgi:hypothetical protein
MSRHSFMLCAALLFCPASFAADAPATDACNCKEHGSKCEGGCCSTCSGDAKKGATCDCKDDHCKSCPVCGKKKAK